MKIETRFSPGDLAWVFDGSVGAHQLTIGQVSVTVIDSPGTGVGALFSNYKPQQGREERYMCVETGVCSGTVYTLDVHIFADREQCLAAHAARIQAEQAALASIRASKIERAQRAIAEATRELHYLEGLA